MEFIYLHAGGIYASALSMDFLSMEDAEPLLQSRAKAILD